MATSVVIGNGDVFRFSHPFLSLCPLRPRHSGVTGAPTALCFCLALYITLLRALLCF